MVAMGGLTMPLISHTLKLRYTPTVRLKLTAHNIKKLKPKDKPYEARDSEIKYFLARIQPTGTIDYYYSYQNNCGRTKNIKTIHSEWSSIHKNEI